MRTAYFDIDDTIWPLLDWVCESAKKLYDREVDPEEVTWWEFWPDTFGKNWWNIFVDPLSVERIPERHLFPGARNAISYMYSEGFDIHFISHNPKGKELEPHVRAWLEKELGFADFDLTIFGAHNDKIAIMEADPTAWGIFEDKAETMRKAVKAGYRTFCKDRAVNRKLQKEFPELIVFTDWNEVPNLVKTELFAEAELDRLVGVGVA